MSPTSSETGSAAASSAGTASSVTGGTGAAFTELFTAMLAPPLGKATDLSKGSPNQGTGAGTGSLSGPAAATDLPPAPGVPPGGAGDAAVLVQDTAASPVQGPGTAAALAIVAGPKGLGAQGVDMIPPNGAGKGVATGAQGGSSAAAPQAAGEPATKGVGTRLAGRQAARSGPGTQLAASVPASATATASPAVADPPALGAAPGSAGLDRSRAASQDLAAAPLANAPAAMEAGPMAAEGDAPGSAAASPTAPGGADAAHTAPGFAARRRDRAGSAEAVAAEAAPTGALASPGREASVAAPAGASAGAMAAASPVRDSGRALGDAAPALASSQPGTLLGLDAASFDPAAAVPAAAAEALGGQAPAMAVSLPLPGSHALGFAAGSAEMAVDPVTAGVAGASGLPTRFDAAPGRAQTAQPTSGSGAPPAQQVAPALVQLAQGPAGGSMVMQLSPDELGHVGLRIDRTADGAATVQVTADRPETLRLLVADQHGLHQALDSAGLPSQGRTVSFALDAPATASSAIGGGDASFSGQLPGDGGGGARQGQPGGQFGAQSRPGSLPAFGAGDPVLPTYPGAWMRAGVDITA